MDRPRPAETSGCLARTLLAAAWCGVAAAASAQQPATDPVTEPLAVPVETVAGALPDAVAATNVTEATVATEPPPPAAEATPAPRLLAPAPIPQDAQLAVAPLKKQALQCLMLQPSTVDASADDATRLAASQTLLDTGQPLQAALELMRWRNKAQTLPAGFWPLQTEAFIEAGAPDWAKALLADPAARFSPADKQQLRLALADWRYRHGESEDAGQLLAPLKTAFQRTPQDLAEVAAQNPAQLRQYSTAQARWQDLQSRVDLAEDRNAEALKVLATGSQNDAAQAAFGNTDSAPQRPYLQYNLGVSLIRAGRIAEGRAVLDRLGRLPGDDAELLALKDKANLTLGWQFLKERQGATATAIFERVRIDGPFSNRALLGIGWAELADKGERQLRSAPADSLATRDHLPPNVVASMLRTGAISCEEANRYEGFAPVPCSSTPFSRARLPSEKDALLKRALVPWLELAERDPLDTAVQESWLAIPYALQQLDARAEATRQYAEAIARLESLRLVYLATIESADAGRLLPAAPVETPPAAIGVDARFDGTNSELQRLLADALPEHAWQNGLRDERELQWLAQQLEAGPPSPLQRRCGPGLPSQLRSTAAARRLGLDQQAAAILREKLALLDRYLLAARAAMSRSMDPIPGMAAAAKPAETSDSSVLGRLGRLLKWFRLKSSS